MAEPIYLDNNATTPLAPEVRAVLASAIQDWFANPASQHGLGLACRAAVEEARRAVGTFIGCGRSADITFTSGATESIARAFRIGCATGVEQIVVSVVEHAAVLDAAASEGITKPVAHIPVDQAGGLEFETLEAALRKAKSFVSIGQVNNETGVIADIPKAAAICRRFGAILHVDAAQAVGRVAVDVGHLGCDFLSLSPHKFHGPKGIGILVARNFCEAATQAERRGTLNVHGILGAAAAISALGDWRRGVDVVMRLRDLLENEILRAVAGSDVNGRGASRVGNTSNIYFPERDAADLVAALSRRGVYVSAGAACSTGGMPSHVIGAMGLGQDRANSSLRFSLSRFTTEHEIRRAVDLIIDSYKSTLPVKVFNQ